MVAYHVYDPECGGYIVFHNTPGLAKSFALQTIDQFMINEFVELRSKRFHNADHLAKDKPYYLEMCEHSDIYFKLEWNCFTAPECSDLTCKLKIKYETESTAGGKNGIC